MLADSRSDIEAGSQPGRSNPKYGNLQVPGASDCVGQVLVQREAVEAVALDSVVSRQDAHENLDAPENYHDEEILEGRALRRCWLKSEEGIFLRIRAVDEDLFLCGIPPDKAADSRQQTNEAEDTPEDGSGVRYIADQRLMGPVVCVRCLRPWTIRAASPGGPPEERGELLLLCSIHQCAAWDGVLGTASGKDIGIVSPKLLKCCSAIGAQDNSIARSIIGVGPHLANQTRLEHGLLIETQSIEACRTISERPSVK